MRKVGVHHRATSAIMTYETRQPRASAKRCPKQRELAKATNKPQMEIKSAKIHVTMTNPSQISINFEFKYWTYKLILNQYLINYWHQHRSISVSNEALITELKRTYFFSGLTYPSVTTLYYLATPYLPSQSYPTLVRKVALGRVGMISPMSSYLIQYLVPTYLTILSYLGHYPTLPVLYKNTKRES